ncbi:hypothetical protein GOP47_0027346 [Adiantum capillus-veneris]|nr:hypothetical protein GOP47_0027346 [Adiantum capillus-veneris]
MTVEVATPRASLESSVLDSSRDNASSTTRTLLNDSSALLSNLAPQSSKEWDVKQLKLQLQGCTHAELRTKLKADLISKLEVEAERNATALTCSSISLQQHLCMNMLSNGKPKSFIEFFNLTYSELPEDTPKDSDAKREKALSPEALCSVCTNLVEAELARRNGDFEKLSHINFIIANTFENSGHFHKAVFYLLRSLENSKEANNPFQEAKVKFNLGKVNVKIGSCSDAITWFEEYLEFARDKEDTEGLVLGSRRLLEVYDLSAKRARRKGQLRRGLELFQKSVHMAEICGDNRAKAEAKHQLGLIHQKLSENQWASGGEPCMLEEEGIPASPVYRIHWPVEEGSYQTKGRTHDFCTFDKAIMHLGELIPLLLLMSNGCVPTETVVKRICNGSQWQPNIKRYRHDGEEAGKWKSRQMAGERGR